MSIVEVAKIAGVSTATVSRVMNNLPGVREETVAQVKAVMSQLNYKRLRSRSVRKRPAYRSTKLRTGYIAVITIGQEGSWLQIPIMASVVAGIQRGAQANNLKLILGEMSDPGEPSDLLVERQIDGAVVFLSSWVPMAMYETTFKSMQRYVPIVWAMGLGTVVGGVDHVAPDNVGIGHLAYSYLKGLNCKQPAFLTANPQWALMRMRGQAFLNNAFDDGRSPTVYAVAESEELVRPYAGRMVIASTLPELISKLVADGHRPDGLFIGNDQTASEVYPILNQTSLKIGKDLQVVSCDAEEARLSGMFPRPATIDIGGEEIGYRCVNRLLNRIDKPHGPPLMIQVTPRLLLPTKGQVIPHH